MATAVVIVGCVGEFLSEFTNVLNVRNNPDRRHRLGKASALVLIAGLAVEPVCLVQTNRLFGLVIAELRTQAAQANERSLQLEAEIQPRRLTDAQRSAVAGSLRGFAGGKLLIASQWIDAEAAQVARETKTALNRAGIGTSFRTKLRLRVGQTSSSNAMTSQPGWPTC